MYALFCRQYGQYLYRMFDICKIGKVRWENIVNSTIHDFFWWETIFDIVLLLVKQCG